MSTSGELDEEDEGETYKPKKSKSDDFFLSEYTNLSQAHYTTNTSISAFFRSYLVLVGLPIPVIALLLTQVAQKKEFNGLVEVFSGLVPLCCSVLGFVGFSVMVYIINLRLDSLLYARAVNGIRKHFLNRSDLSIEDEIRVRVLPRSSYLPRYLELHYSFPVVLVFTILDTFYFAIGCYWYFTYAPITSDRSMPFWLIGAIATSVIGHVVAYHVLVRYRENRYLRSQIIGTDIDGVLNLHREHFCAMLRERCGKELDPGAISVIPVHENAQLAITSADEDAVFNHPRYWTDLPVANEAAEMLGRIKNGFGYSVVVFTHRAWPEDKKIPAASRKEYRDAWKKALGGKDVNKNSIYALTKAWLAKHKIPYDKLIVEKGNVHTADRRTRTRNRFIYCERKKVRLFVEDDLEKAVKLANICELVFLIDHPYNQMADGSLPKNIVRVQSWFEIYKWIRKLY